MKTNLIISAIIIVFLLALLFFIGTQYIELKQEIKYYKDTIIQHDTVYIDSIIIERNFYKM